MRPPHPVSRADLLEDVIHGAARAFGTSEGFRTCEVKLARSPFVSGALAPLRDVSRLCLPSRNPGPKGLVPLAKQCGILLRDPCRHGARAVEDGKVLRQPGARKS